MRTFRVGFGAIVSSIRISVLITAQSALKTAAAATHPRQLPVANTAKKISPTNGNKRCRTPWCGSLLR
jgi:hypothetical protein